MQENDRLLPPLPADQRKPTLDSKLADNTHLVWWLATQEAKALIYPKIDD